MNQANYCIITIANCDSSFLQKAMELTQTFKSEIEEKANPVSIRFGTLSTGEHAGSIAFFQNYSTLSDFEKSFDIYQKSEDYKALFTGGNARVILRNIVKYTPITFEENLIGKAKHLVLTRVDTADSMAGYINKLAPIFSEAGALTYRLGTVITGSNIGNQLLGVTYASIDAVEKVYTFLESNPDYKELLTKVNVNMRNIVRLQ